MVWLFFRHRDQYPTWRNLLFFISIVCALIQLVPVAPPRLFPELGFIDTGAVYGPRVYDSGEGGQLAAMPSLHVGWAVLIGIAVVMVSRSKWRWLVLAHPILTVFAVTVTAYHWLLDGIVAVAILLIGMAGEHWLRQTRERSGGRQGHSASASSIASTSLGSSGVTSGLKRVIEPSGPTRNFSKFHLMSPS